MAAARVRYPRSLPEPADIVDFGPRALKRYKGLHKHKNVTLVQIRTGKISLRAFLTWCRVPSIVTPLYLYGSGPETLEHLIIHCPEL